MSRDLPSAGIECVIIPRAESGGRAISASEVRQLIHDGRLDDILPLVPRTTYEYFMTEAGRRTAARITGSSSVVHY
jgi:[citrate (pro-3S)-lyase] ligase